LPKKHDQSYRYIVILLLLLQWGAYHPAMAQQSMVFDEAYPEFRDGLDLFQKEKFLAAQENFQNTMDAIANPQSEVRIDAQYHHALCALYLFHDDAEVLLKRFIESNPENTHRSSAIFNLGRYYFRKRDYYDLILLFRKLDPLDISVSDRAEYNFKLGYAYLQEGQKEKAAQYFYEIKDTDNKYVTPARYYYAHLAYESGKYQSALENFRKIGSDPQFGPLVPYYISQIYYLQERYEELLEYAPPLLDSVIPNRELEIKKLIGDAYYETEQYEEATPYLKDYILRRPADQEDRYQLGYAYYKSGEYDLAVASLQKAIGENDSLSQSAYYYIASAAIKSDRKSEARTAFKFASEYDADKDLQEDALFNYAKLAYELSFHPYDDAIQAFEKFISNYPNSDKLDDAYEYLLGVYYTTKNYEEALKSIDRINSRDIRLLDAKQRISYYRGVELYNLGDYAEAIDLFAAAESQERNPKIKAKATYWMAESYYQLRDFDNAIFHYNNFLSSAGSRSIDYFNRAYYNLAYAYYEKGAYASANFWFQEYVNQADRKYKGLINDAYLRMGDGYFVQKKYNRAIDAYDKAVRLNVANTDYSLLQLSIAQGLLGNYKAKANSLKKLINRKEKSIYTDDALSEIGKTYLVLDMPEDALTYYNQLINEHPKSNLLAEAYLKLGLIYYNRKEDDLALNAFDQVIQKYPSSGSSREALEKVRKIFIDKGDLQAFEDYVNGVPFADISKSKLDSTAYIIAENHYLEGKCEKAVRDFSNYLKRYPNGLFSLNARFYRADCESRQGFKQEAIQDFEAVVAKPTSKFTEKSYYALAKLYEEIDSNQLSIKSYEKLIQIAKSQAWVNQAEERLMQLYNEEEQHEDAVTMAKTILKRNPLSDDLWQSAKMILARTSYKNEDYEQAIDRLDSLASKSSEKAAEAKYLMARIYYLQGKYTKSDTMIYRLVDQVPSFPYWIAKGFILLADNFIAREDYYNARITFQSVIDNADIPELVEIAKEKLAIMENREAESEKGKNPAEPIEIDLGGEESSGGDMMEPEKVEVKDEE
jgi:TolA-binding protein